MTTSLVLGLKLRMSLNVLSSRLRFPLGEICLMHSRWGFPVPGTGRCLGSGLSLPGIICIPVPGVSLSMWALAPLDGAAIMLVSASTLVVVRSNRNRVLFWWGCPGCTPVSVPYGPGLVCRVTSRQVLHRNGFRR